MCSTTKLQPLNNAVLCICIHRMKPIRSIQLNPRNVCVCVLAALITYILSLLYYVFPFIDQNRIFAIFKKWKSVVKAPFCRNRNGQGDNSEKRVKGQ